ncbi:AfsR/SARP family transcriptional regulator [Streptomyces clavuligerus]|uniref:AfsR/SARP family transcriptional regulator n=1 Tax=Streptomyces clavuligerus TaxID=1901 RepID=UPI001E36BA55|nr:BTAD domain-containing putative transcriptional regulator [Streptomyces clavuligerus]
MTLRLLKGFALSVDHIRVPICSSAQRLIAFLALQGMPRTRTYVAGTLWPDVTSSRAHANLRSSLWRATRTGHHVIDTSAQELAVSRHVTVDLHDAVARAHRLLDAGRSCDDILTTQTRIDLSADLLPEWLESEWVLMEREQYHQLRLYALESMAERLTALRRHGEAVAAGLAAVRAEPLRESAHRVLVKAHLAAGNRGAALRQYEQCRSILSEELGLEPSQTLKSLLPAPVDGTDEPVDWRGRRAPGEGVCALPPGPALCHAEESLDVRGGRRAHHGGAGPAGGAAEHPGRDPLRPAGGET